MVQAHIFSNSPCSRPWAYRWIKFALLLTTVVAQFERQSPAVILTLALLQQPAQSPFAIVFALLPSSTIVLSLKDPAAVFAVYKPLLREISQVATRIISYQSGGAGDIVLAAEDFGVHSDAVRALMRGKPGTRWTSGLPD